MNLLHSQRGRALLFACLYFSEGAPIGFIWWALPTLLRAEGVPVENVTGLTALLVLPWSFKFLWAPLVDSLRLPQLAEAGEEMAVVELARQIHSCDSKVEEPFFESFVSGNASGKEISKR